MELNKYANATHDFTVKQALVKSQTTNPNQKITQDSPAYARGKRNKIL